MHDRMNEWITLLISCEREIKIFGYIFFPLISIQCCCFCIFWDLEQFDTIVWKILMYVLITISCCSISQSDVEHKCERRRLQDRVKKRTKENFRMMINNVTNMMSIVTIFYTPCVCVLIWILKSFLNLLIFFWFVMTVCLSFFRQNKIKYNEKNSFVILNDCVQK